MTNDAENRAAAILLPGQELVVEEKEPEASVATTVELPSSDTYSFNGPSWEEIIDTYPVMFSEVDSDVMYYAFGKTLKQGTLMLSISFLDNHAEVAYDDGFGLLESASVSAKVDYQTGILSLRRVSAPIQYMTAKFEVEDGVQW